eukprot:5377734-Amphidinium_carterae.5
MAPNRVYNTLHSLRTICTIGYGATLDNAWFKHVTMHKGSSLHFDMVAEPRTITEDTKLPAPKQFDGRNPQFNEWAGEVKAYLTIHNVSFENYMDSCSRSIETINIVDLQVDYKADDVTRLNTRFPAEPAKDADNYEVYIDVKMNIRKKRDDIANFT